MGTKIEELLLELESKCNMAIYPPASPDALCELKKNYSMLPIGVMDVYAVSDGIEINIPGTVVYSVRELLDANRSNTSGRIVIGRMSFGDEIVVAEDGKIYQIDHETGEEFLDWATLENFLEDELLALD